MNRLRALETGRFLIRATNTGISAIIDDQGRILQQSALFQTDVITGFIQPLQGITPYARFGHVPLLLLLCVMLGAIQFFRVFDVLQIINRLR
jgi:apolipoprotein N-acyltransferase